MTKKQNDLLRVYAILQHNANGITNLASCFTNQNTANKVCDNLNKTYKQYYYVESILLNCNYQKVLARLSK